MIMLSNIPILNIYNILGKLYEKIKKISLMNYSIIVAVIILVVAMIIFLLIRNHKDEKKFKQDVIDTELPPEKDDKENI